MCYPVRYAPPYSTYLPERQTTADGETNITRRTNESEHRVTRSACSQFVKNLYSWHQWFLLSGSWDKLRTIVRLTECRIRDSIREMPTLVGTIRFCVRFIYIVHKQNQGKPVLNRNQNALSDSAHEAKAIYRWPKKKSRYSWHQLYLLTRSASVTLDLCKVY